MQLPGVIMTKKSRIAATAAAAVFLCAASAACILYGMGVYDISFIPRSKPSETSIETYDISHRPGDETFETNPPPAIDDNLSGLFDPDAISSDSETQKSSETSAEEINNRFTTISQLKEQGYKRSSAAYSRGGSKLGLVTGSVVSRTQLHTGGRNTLQLYMGYIIYNNGEYKYALGANGIVSVAGIGRLDPAYLRDSDGHPLWISRDDGKYYYLNDNSEYMTEVIIDTNYAPPLRYDSPVGYGNPKGRLHRYYAITQEARKFDAAGNDVTETVDVMLSEAQKAGKDITDANVYAKLGVPSYTIKGVDCIRWGYLNDNNYVSIQAKYKFATEFDDSGYALVADEKGAVSIINSNGKTVITRNSKVLYPEERNKRPVWEDYYLPETFGLESSGMFGFDHGYIRMRYMQYDYKKETEVVQDYNVLVREDGTWFDIPSGYSLEGYSDGVLLLAKDGRYGMLNISGKWIIQPAYTYATPFVSGLAVIGNSSGKYAMIDTSGNLVLSFEYDYISLPSSGVIVAHRAGGWQIFNIMSK